MLEQDCDPKGLKSRCGCGEVGLMEAPCSLAGDGVEVWSDKDWDCLPRVHTGNV